MNNFDLNKILSIISKMDKTELEENISKAKSILEKSDNLKNLIINSIGKVYNIENIDTLYEKSIWYMTNFFKLANYDPYGIKLRLYTLIDKISPKWFIKVKELSFYNKYKEIDNWLNINNNKWYKPWNKAKSYNCSFLELYDLAKRDAVNTIIEVTDMLDKDKFCINKLNDIFKNLSFATGLDCSEEVIYKYFEY